MSHEALSHEPPTTGRATFTDVLSVREYRAVWLAQVLSMVGDQLAIVALTWLVYERSQSALLTALTYAIGFVPWLVGGPLLSGLADRYPRREVMVVCDLARAGLVLVIALPGVPLVLACALLFVTETLAAPFTAARAAVLPDILTGDRYVVGTAIGNITNQLGQVVGFALGGLLVALVEPRLGLALDSASFLLSAGLLAFRLTSRPAARVSTCAAHRSLLPDALAGLRLIRRDPQLWVLAGLGLLAIFYVVPEGLAAPYADQAGGGATAVGLLLAAGPAGSVIGSVLISRWLSVNRRLGLMGAMSLGTCVPLVTFALVPGVVWALIILFVSGLASAYQLAANAAFVTVVPAESRGQVFGLVQGAMSVGQGVAIVIAGAVAHWWSPSTVMTAAGAAGCIAALWLGRSWARLGAPRLN